MCRYSVLTIYSESACQKRARLFGWRAPPARFAKKKQKKTEPWGAPSGHWGPRPRRSLLLSPRRRVSVVGVVDELSNAQSSHHGVNIDPRVVLVKQGGRILSVKFTEAATAGGGVGGGLSASHQVATNTTGGSVTGITGTAGGTGGGKRKNAGSSQAARPTTHPPIRA